MHSLDGFLGKWLLIPERCKYQVGSPPRSGSYEISCFEIAEDKSQLLFKMQWMDEQRELHELEYSEMCDGQYHPYPGSAFADEICLKLTSDTLLESFSRRQGNLVMSASRELVERDLLKIIMSGVSPDGNEYHNLSFYRRTEALSGAAKIRADC